MLLFSCAHPTAGSAKVFGRDTREPEARRPIGYLPENHRFPIYMTGWSMLDFYGALSGMDSTARRKRIPELLDLVGPRAARASSPPRQIFEGHAAAGRPRAGADASPAGCWCSMSRATAWIRWAANRSAMCCRRSKRGRHDLSEFASSRRGGACSAAKSRLSRKDKLALSGTVQELTGGSGYRVEACSVPELLETELRARARSFTANNGSLQLLLARVRKRIRRSICCAPIGCEIESLATHAKHAGRGFMKTVDAREANR